MNRYILKWEVFGIVFIVIIGSALHFVFDLAGGWRPLAIIAAVNESVWEHLKLGVWPALIYGLMEYRHINKLSSNFVFAKAIGILIIPVAITVLFYGYTAFTSHILAVDIAIFVIAVVLGQMTAYKILTAAPLPARTKKMGIVVVLLLMIAFATLTHYPPQLPIFRDPVSGGYGIQ
ncbi:hypothetical protein EU538_12770 [Candidatus Thorarchaeota archaeon]|nr:MAG: hypothetical protein EU538_12770 [Candidatus Thorarchaeota archaeon]